MIGFGEKVMAALALKRLDMGDLSELSGIHTNTLTKVRNNEDVNERTLRSVQRAIEGLGIRFTDKGVEETSLLTEIYSGSDHMMRLLDDIEGTSRLYINGANEKLLTRDLFERVKALRAGGLKMKHLIKEGDTYMRGDVSEYRWVPEENYTNQVRFIYGSTLAVSTDEEIIIIRNQGIAEAEARQFNLLWKLLPQPDSSTCDERYEL